MARAAPAPLKALMVDVDGVVVVTPEGGWGATLEADLGLSLATLQAQFFAPHWREVSLGRAGLHERLGPVLARHAPHLTSAALVAYWFEKDARLDHGLLDQLAELRAGGLALHLATVQEHLRADHLWTALGLRDRFDAIHYSAAYGCGKPDAAFFERVCERTGFAPGELLLLDDRRDNVEAARAAGWRAALWTGSERVADLLTP
jgi:putative hydrolase of the HAD superfamily